MWKCTWGSYWFGAAARIAEYGAISRFIRGVKSWKRLSGTEGPKTCSGGGIGAGVDVLKDNERSREFLLI